MKKIQGFQDSPLTRKGKQLIEEWGATLSQWKWHRIVASDLGRVQQTVEILNRSLNLPIHFEHRLREQSWGEWEGLTIPYIRENFPQELERRVALGWEFSAPGGESRNYLRKRLFTLLKQLHSNYPGEKILIVCHQGVIKATLYHIAGRAFLPEEDPLVQHNSFHLITCNKGDFTSRKLNIPRDYKSED